MNWSRLRSGTTRGSVFGAVILVIGIVAGTGRLGDNSFFTHLVTGRLLVSGHLPSTDPYTFTAHGTPWVIQSWFASLLYGLADNVAGGTGIRLLVAVTTVALSLVLWRLSRPAMTIGGRLVAVLPALGLGFVTWGARPLIFGLLCFALVLLILEEERDPRWLIPIMWVWVNTHGSFPLSIVLIVAVGVGSKIDRADLSFVIRALKWCVIGILVGGINPVGPRLLWFPIQLLEKQKVLSLMTEWQAPSFVSLWQRTFLGVFLLVMLLIPRLPAAHRYRMMIPSLVFTALGLMAMRNISLAVIVLIVPLAYQLRGIGTLKSSVRRPAYTYVAGLIVVVGLALGGVALSQPSFNYSSYPVAATNWLASNGRLGADHPLAVRDTVGNYLELRTTGRVKVFADDRVDMLPTQVVNDELVLIRGGASWAKVLDRYKIDTVLWERGAPLDVILTESDKWKQVYPVDRGRKIRGDWVVYERVTS